ncbi:MAG: hypothetical protein Q8P02_05255 [Candidatus Micrarchaeota archaeon]|nr:hypothetical protein [Candidatus Micrarchaeota archaeon]
MTGFFLYGMLLVVLVHYFPEPKKPGLMDLFFQGALLFLVYGGLSLFFDALGALSAGGLPAALSVLFDAILAV